MNKILILTIIIFIGFQSFSQQIKKSINFSVEIGKEKKTQKLKLIVGKVNIRDITLTISTIIDTAYPRFHRESFTEITE